MEPMMMGFYMLFIAVINTESFIGTSCVFACCILSRYYIAFWLPLWFLVMYLSDKKRYLWKTIAGIAILILVLYIIPFTSRNWEIVKSIGNGYDIALESEWTKNINSQGNPAHIYEGNGFAYLFYDHYHNTDKKQGFYLLKKLLLVLPLASIFLLGIWYWYKRSKINYRIFLMASFKIFLTIFLNLMIVPYTYLFSLSLFISIAIFAEQSLYLTDQITPRSPPQELNPTINS